MLTVTLKRDGYVVVKTPLGDVTVWYLGASSRGQVGVDAPRDWVIQRDDVEYRAFEGNNVDGTRPAAVDLSSNGQVSAGAE